MKKLEEILKALEAIQKATDLTEAQGAATNLMDIVKDYDAGWLAEVNKKNGEAQNLRGKAKQADALQTALDALKSKHGKIIKTIGLDDDMDEIDEALEAIAAKIQVGETSGKTQTELQAQLGEVKKSLTNITKQLEKATNDNNTLNTSLSEERNKRYSSAKQTELLNILTANKAVKPDKLAKMLSHSVEVDVENGEALLFVNELGEKVPLKDGLTKFLADNPEFVANHQQTGSGSSGAGAGGGKLKITSAQMKDPTFYRANRDVIVSGNYEEVE